jgi:hypothetical protein
MERLKNISVHIDGCKKIFAESGHFLGLLETVCDGSGIAGGSKNIRTLHGNDWLAGIMDKKAQQIK